MEKGCAAFAQESSVVISLIVTGASPTALFWYSQLANDTNAVRYPNDIDAKIVLHHFGATTNLLL
jgi:hypothetical protein